MNRMIGNVGRSNQARWFVLVALIFSAAVVVSYYFLGTYAAFQPTTASHSAQGDKGNEELARILSRAAMPDKTVIVTCLNEAWAALGSVFDLMLDSFRSGNNTRRLAKHLVVVSLDEKAHSRCLTLGLNCFLLRIEGFNFSGGEAFFKTPNYLEIIWRKVDLLHSVLALGYNFFFSDTDIMWFRDPFIHLQDDVDFQVSCDKYNGRPRDIYHNFPNTGIMYVKSNRRTVLFFKLWYYSRHFYEGKHEQEVFNIIKLSPIIKIIGLTINFLDPTWFGGFCQPSHDISQVCTMHANCCVGLENKVHDLKLVLSDWKNYSSLSPPTNPPYPYKWSAPKQCYIR